MDGHIIFLVISALLFSSFGADIRQSKGRDIGFWGNFRKNNNNIGKINGTNTMPTVRRRALLYLKGNVGDKGLNRII